MKYLLLVPFCFLSFTATANDVVVTVSFEPQQTISEEMVSGILMAQVMNLSNGPVSNVNLRPDAANDVAIPHEVLQFGSLASGGSGVTYQPFHAAQEVIDSGRPTQWRLDYDQAGGEHRQLIFTID